MIEAELAARLTKPTSPRKFTLSSSLLSHNYNLLHVVYIKSLETLDIEKKCRVGHATRTTFTRD